LTLGVFLGIAAGVVHIVAYIIYNWYSRNRPNIAAWGVWGFLTLLNTSSYFVMSSDWVKSILTIVNSVLCIMTLGLALYRGKFDKIDIWDKLAFVVGIVAGLVWIRWHSATSANLILQISIAAGFIPLYRGVWRNPDCERALPWLVWTVGYGLNIVTVVLRWQGQLQDLAYPVNCLVLHFGVALLVTVRIRNAILGKPDHSSESVADEIATGLKQRDVALRDK
jgi:hypothetical protein